MWTLLIGNRSAALLIALSVGIAVPALGLSDGEQRRRVDEQRAREELAAVERAHHEQDGAIDEIQEHIHLLRRQHLDLESMLAQIGTRDDQDKDRMRALQSEMLQIEYEIQRRQLDLERHVVDRDRAMEEREMMRMTGRLDYIAGWREVAFDPPQAVVMATQAVVEMHLGSGDAEGAAAALEELLTQVDDRGSRTALRFALKDVYIELGRVREAVRHMVAVIRENSGASH